MDPIEKSSELNSSISYAREKLGSAVYRLATGTEGIKGRLAEAFIELAIIQEEDLPQDLRIEWKAIRSELTKGKMLYDPVIRNGAIEARPRGLLYSTLRFMRLDKARHLAERICNLEYRLRNYPGDSIDRQE